MSVTEDRRGRVRVETGQKRVRAFLAGRLVADSLRPLLVWESPHYPTYYFPAADVLAELVATGTTEHSPSRGDGQVLDVRVGDRTASGAAIVYRSSPFEELREAVRLEWDAMDQWFEEDEPVSVHPRDPYTRVDILTSSRRIRIEVDGVTVADSTRARLLFETGLPVRSYLPLTDVRMDLLRPSDTETRCPYKGTASYYDLEVGGRTHRDLVWTYRSPLPESQKILGLVAFYDEQVDVFIDEVAQPPLGDGGS